MSDETLVLNKFKEDVNAHFDIIRDCVKRDERKEAYDWTNELLIMRDTWESVMQGRELKIASGSFARGWKVVVDTKETKEMAQQRFNYINEVLAVIQRMFMQKRWM